MVGWLLGAVSPVRHEGLHQGWKQTSIRPLLILHKIHETSEFLQNPQITLVFTQIQKQNIQMTNTNFGRNSRSGITLLKKNKTKKTHIKLGRAGIVDFGLIYQYQIYFISF